MNPLGLVSEVAYAAFLIGVLLVVWRLVTERWSSAVSIWSAWALSAASLFGGLLLAAAVTPDWSPFTMFWLAVPLWGVAVWAASFARLMRRGASAPSAGMRALWRAVPALLVAPLGLLVAGFLWVPAVAASITALYLKRPSRAKSPLLERDGICTDSVAGDGSWLRP